MRRAKTFKHNKDLGTGSNDRRDRRGGWIEEAKNMKLNPTSII